MRNKLFYFILILFFFKTNAFSQKNYQVVKIDRESIENFDLIYLKKINSKKYFRINVRKSEDIKNCRSISVGSILSLKLIKNKKIKEFRDSKEFDKNNIFYEDYFETNKVNLKCYCKELDNICP